MKDDLTNTVRSISKLQISKDYPAPEASHPGVNVRYAYANYGKHFGKFEKMPTIQLDFFYINCPCIM